MLLISTPVMADTISLTSDGGTVSGVSNPVVPPAPGSDIVQSCYPIGKTTSGELVYSMDCKFPISVTYTTGQPQNSNPSDQVPLVNHGLTGPVTNGNTQK